MQNRKRFLRIDFIVVKKILLFFFNWKLTLCLFAFVSIFFIPADLSFIPEYLRRNDFPYLVWIWGNFDGSHYIGIADRGYFNYEYGFFPLFPVVISLLYRVLRTPFLLNALLISNVSLLLSLIIFIKILSLDKKLQLFDYFILIIFFYPTTFYLQAAYNDSLFLLLATSCLYFSRKKSWLISSIFASLATLTRLNGLALLFPIIIEYLTQFANDEKKTWSFKQIFSSLKAKVRPIALFQDKIISIALIPLAFFSYLFYIHKQFGSWELVFSSMKVWEQNKVTIPLQVFWRYFKILVLHPSFQPNYWIAVIEITSVFLYIFLLFYSFKKIRVSYWIFFLISIFIPSLTGTFQGMPRYGLQLYPFFLTLSLFLENRSFTIKILLGILGLILTFLLVGLFTRGHFVA